MFFIDSTQRKRYIAECFKLGITPITIEDNILYSRFFDKYKSEYRYANSWFYITQAVNGVSKHNYPLGFKFETDSCLFSIGIFRSPYTKKFHFHIVNPIGVNVVKHLNEFVPLLHRITRTPVYLKKLDANIFKTLLNYPDYKEIINNEGELSPYSWHKDAPLEDDMYPEVILDINNTLGLLETGSGPNQVKEKIRNFLKKNDLSSVLWEDIHPINKRYAIKVVNKFFKFKKEGDIDISSPVDYRNMIDTTSAGRQNENFLQKLMFIKGKPLAVICTEQINGKSCHGLYANIALYKEFPNLSEYIIIETLKILKKLGVNFLNMGGSETKGLHKFKCKFRPYKTQQSYWLVYDKINQDLLE